MTTIEEILAGFAGPQTDTVARLAELVDWLRPARDETADAAAWRLRKLCEAIETQPTLTAGLRSTLLKLFAERRAVLLLATSGIYPDTGGVVETRRRIAHKILPEAADPSQLKDVFGRILRPSDAHWLEAVPIADWEALIRALDFAAATDRSGLVELTAGLLEAWRVVAHRIAASGLEPEMLRLDPRLELHQSPFLAQCEEALALGNRIESRAGDAAGVDEDERHYLVLLDQCRATIERVRRRAQQGGASFHLTFRLRRLRQHLDRAQALAGIAAALAERQQAALTEQAAALTVQLAVAECRRNSLRRFWHENLELVALRVTENAGRAGEHYITEDRREYLSLLRSAVGGGFVIAFMAANKILLGKLGLAPLTEVLAFSLNYAIGFVLIHILHFSVATKQPAMTANAIAGAIGEAKGRERERDLEPLVELITRMVRSQLAAIAGNVGLAVPTAMLVGLAIHWQTGAHFISPDKAHHLLADTNPIASGAVLYAAVAGVCLFLAGLIAGYYDNLCGYNRIPERLLQLRWPPLLLGMDRWQRIAGYIENNLGALAGNFFFGFLLGGATGIGVLFGLPVDIRHIAFSSAYWGYAMVGLDFGVEWTLAALAAAGVLAIGIVNLAVSFYLAMWVGIRARGVSFGSGLSLARALGRRLLRQPRTFFLPPAAAAN